MNVVFLDLDGVINTTNYNGRDLTLPFKMRNGRYTTLTKWDLDCTKYFMELCKLLYKNNWRIVISSTWRTIGGAKEFNEYFKTYFKILLTREITVDMIVGTTPILKNKIRGLEIKEYIKNNNIEKFLIIDDEISDIVEYFSKEEIVFVDSNLGLCASNLKEIENKM